MLNDNEIGKKAANLSRAVDNKENHDMDDTNGPQDEHDCFCIRCCAIRLLSAITAAKEENFKPAYEGETLHERIFGEKEPDVSADNATRQKKSTLEYVTEQIVSCGERFRMDCGITPFDVCLGPAEFQLIAEENAQHKTTGTIPAWHHDARHLWYSGMRLRLMNTPGILVGVLESRGMRGKTPSVPSASPASGASGVSAEGEKVPNESVDVEEWTVEEADTFTTEKLVEMHNGRCATLRAEIARLRKILEEKGAV